MDVFALRVYLDLEFEVVIAIIEINKLESILFCDNIILIKSYYLDSFISLKYFFCKIFRIFKESLYFNSFCKYFKIHCNYIKKINIFDS